MSLAILHGGTYYHAEAILGARYRDRFERVIYAPDLKPGDLDGVGVLIVPDRLNPSLLRRHRPLLLGHLARGGTLVVFAETQAHAWVPGVDWTFRPTNFWWWRQQGATPAQRVVRPDHELFRFVDPAATIWHFHGVLRPPPGAEALMVVPPEPGGRDDGGCLLYDDRVSTKGRLIVSTLDPFYHHGSHFMPATTRFLDGFLPWAQAVARGEAVSPARAAASG
ncbi:MAG: hypothetical protein L6R19_01720 [Alphaproteobacteria bacterium]|nr:hypothetical protein [Alphaproteobacteria bacterium]